MDIIKRINVLLLSVLISTVAAANSLGDLFAGFGNPKFDLNIRHPASVSLKVTTVAIAKPEGQCSEDLATRVEEDFGRRLRSRRRPGSHSRLGALESGRRRRAEGDATGGKPNDIMA